MPNKATSANLERRRPKTKWAPFHEPKMAYEKYYAIIGILLGFGCPIGALFLRLWWLRYSPQWVLIRHEITNNTVFYAYMGVGTVIAFALFGYFLGKRGQDQRVENATLRSRVHKLHLISVKDQLTKAFSHAYMQENLQLEMESARRTGQPVSIAMIDFDDFKKINDTYGHLFGDNVLADVSETIRMNMRLKDILCRYGGEEFLILMPETDLGTATQVAERVRIAVSELEMLPPSEKSAAKTVRITLSVGVATFMGQTQDTATDFIRRADVNLYRAKHEGKNKTCSAPLPVNA